MLTAAGSPGRPVPPRAPGERGQQPCAQAGAAAAAAAANYHLLHIPFVIQTFTNAWHCNGKHGVKKKKAKDIALYNK